jgi:hypothetical protein
MDSHPSFQDLVDDPGHLIYLLTDFGVPIYVSEPLSIPWRSPTDHQTMTLFSDHYLRAVYPIYAHARIDSGHPRPSHVCLSVSGCIGVLASLPCPACPPAVPHLSTAEMAVSLFLLDVVCGPADSATSILVCVGRLGHIYPCPSVPCPSAHIRHKFASIFGDFAFRGICLCHRVFPSAPGILTPGAEIYHTCQYVRGIYIFLVCVSSLFECGMCHLPYVS